MVMGNRGVLLSFCMVVRMLVIVTMKLVAYKIDLAPARWGEKMVLFMGFFMCKGLMGVTGHPCEDVSRVFKLFDL